MNINPLQIFQVRIVALPTDLQRQCLVQFYQPIIGVEAVSLYLTLSSFVVEKHFVSERTLHTQLLQSMNIDLPSLYEARQKLEAVGLLKTFREYKENIEIDRQTLLYDVQLPLDIIKFLNDPLLSGTLYHQIGDHAYYQLLKQWQPLPVDVTQYQEISASFTDKFAYPKAVDFLQEELAEQPFRNQMSHTVTPIRESSTFDFAKFSKFLLSEGISSSELTYVLKNEIVSLHEIHGLDETQMVEVVKLALNPVTKRIQIEALKSVINQQQFFKVQKSTPTFAEFPKQYSPEQLEKRKQSLRANDLNLNEADIEIILACEQLPHELLLNKIKQSKGGFVTDNERYFLKDLMTKVSLLPEIINFLTYYLLVFQGRDNLYKADLQRVASEWQQQKLMSVEQVFYYLRQKENKKQMVSVSKNRKLEVQRTKEVPQWLKEQTNNTAKITQNDELSVEVPYDVNELQAKLNQLAKKGEKNYESIP